MQPTRDHKVIRKWAQARRARPAMLDGSDDGTPGTLKFIVPGAHYHNRHLSPVSWDDFFARFDLLGLAFVFEERSPQGGLSSMNEILRMESELPDYRNWH